MIFRTGFVVALLAGMAAYAQPVVAAAENAASYFMPPAPSSSTPAPATPIAQGSIFVVFGTGLSAGALVQAPSFPLQTQLNGTSISVTSGGQTVSALMVYTLPTQLAAILPSSTPIGAATLTVSYNGQTSKALNIVVTKSVPGIFTTNSQGYGPGIAQVALTGTDIRLNNLTTPGTPGSTMILYGTGLGPITGSDANPPGAVDLRSSEQISVTVGGFPATVVYAGRAPQFPGEDQINIQLPSNVPLGCYTPAVVTVNGVPSNDFELSTGSALGSCVSPFGLSAAAEAKLDAGQTVNVGVFAAIRGAVPPIVAEGAGGLFETVTAGQLFDTYRTLLTAFDVIVYPAAVNTCVVYDALGGASSGPPIPNDFSSIGSTELQPAASLTLSGPNGASQGIIRASSAANAGYLWVNIIGAASPAVLGPGTWMLSGNAGSGISAFSATTTFPTNLTWTNMGSLLTPPRSSGVTLTWTGGGVAADPNIHIFGNATVYNPTDPSQNRGKSFSCTVPANSSPFMVPASITSQLPTPSAAGEYSEGSLGISTGGGSQFTAATASGQPLDGSFFGFGEAFVNSGITWK